MMDAANGPKPLQTFSEWLIQCGMNAEIAAAMVNELGIPSYSVLLACAEPPSVRAELFTQARNKLPFGFYASLRHLIDTCFPHDASENAPEQNGTDCVPLEERVLTPLLDLLAGLLAGLAQDLTICGQRVVGLRSGGLAAPRELIRDKIWQGNSSRAVSGLRLGLGIEELDMSGELEEPVEELEDSRQPCDSYEDLVNGWQPINEDTIGQTQHKIKVETESTGSPSLAEPLDVEPMCNRSSSLPNEASVPAKDPQPNDPTTSPAEQGNRCRSSGDASHCLVISGRDSSDGENKAEQPIRLCSEQAMADVMAGHVGEDMDNRSGTADSWRHALFNEAAEGLQKLTYICSECGKTFSQPGYLRMHARAHQRWRVGESGGSLKSCSYTQRRQPLGKHQFRCEVCGKGFTHSSTLHCHRRIHLQRKPFTCTHCGKAFGQRCHLQDHERIHTGERPFRCEICGRAFTQRSHLVSHGRNVHPEGVGFCGSGGVVSTAHHGSQRPGAATMLLGSTPEPK
uniref:zinc finger protein 70-like n=1 Tax=Myxine glutinosa TaxID=7769 RepID=UPI00358EEA5C